MSLFQKKENLSEQDKKLSVVTFWLFVVCVFAWVVPFAVLFVLNLTTNPVGGALAAALMPSLTALVVTTVLCVIVYYAYKKIMIK